MYVRKRPGSEGGVPGCLSLSDESFWPRITKGVDALLALFHVVPHVIWLFGTVAFKYHHPFASRDRVE